MAFRKDHDPKSGIDTGFSRKKPDAKETLIPVTDKEFTPKLAELFTVQQFDDKMNLVKEGTVTKYSIWKIRFAFTQTQVSAFSTDQKEAVRGILIPTILKVEQDLIEHIKALGMDPKKAVVFTDFGTYASFVKSFEALRVVNDFSRVAQSFGWMLVTGQNSVEAWLLTGIAKAGKIPVTAFHTEDQADSFAVSNIAARIESGE